MNSGNKFPEALCAKKESFMETLYDHTRTLDQDDKVDGDDVDEEDDDIDDIDDDDEPAEDDEVQ